MAKVLLPIAIYDYKWELPGSATLNFFRPSRLKMALGVESNPLVNWVIYHPLLKYLTTGVLGPNSILTKSYTSFHMSKFKTSLDP